MIILLTFILKSEIAHYRPRSESSEGVIFEGDGGGVNTSSSNTESKPLVVGEDFPQEKGAASDVKEVQFMYIQMEFCEKSTLRFAASTF